MAKIIHKDNKLIPAMQRALNSLKDEYNADDVDILKHQLNLIYIERDIIQNNQKP